MPRFGRLLTVSLLLAAPVGFAQDRPGRSAALPSGQTPDADVLRKLTAQLGGGNGMTFSPELIEAAKRFMGENPKIDPAQLQQAKEMLERMSPAEREKLIRQVQGQANFPNVVQPPPNLPVGPRPPVGPQPFPEPQPFPGPPPLPNVPQPNDPRFPDIRPTPFPPSRFPNGMPNTEAAKNAIEFWEKNIGSLNQMPAVRDALIALANSGLDTGPDGKSLWEDIAKDLNSGGGADPDGGGLLKWLKDSTSNWSIGSGGGSGWTPPGSGWSGSGGGGFGTPSAGSIGTVGFVILSLIAAVVIGLFVWKVLPVIREGRAPRPLPGHGPWPVDPRSILTREQLVRAFEYLSVLECGDRARSWNHLTIADALRQLVPASAGYADALARLYAVARYTPESEPLSDAIVAEGRRNLCQLARVSPA